MSGISSTDVTIISLFDILLFLADGTFVSSGLDTEILLVKSSGAGGLIYSSIINGSYSFSETFSLSLSVLSISLTNFINSLIHINQYF